jgi:hypothetical protein
MNEIKSRNKLARRATRSRTVDPASEAQDLWLAITKHEWSTLVLVPAHDGGSALNLARELVEVGTAFRRRPVELICTEGMDLSTATGWLADVLMGIPTRAADIPISQAWHYGRLVVLESVVSNPVGIPIAQAADGALLVVERGVSDLDSARWTVESIGAKCFLGCALVSPP